MSDEETRELERQLTQTPGDVALEERILRSFMRTMGYEKMVRVVDPLQGTGGFLVHEKHITARAAGRWGLLSSYVPGHGGDVWFVGHADRTVGAYSTKELVDETGKSMYEG